jgi:hypothetical protein
LLINQPFNLAVTFTDGSCSGNPGSCGSGAIIFHKEEETEIKRAVSNRSFILLAEIIAIKIVLDYFINSKDQELHNITIFSDSQSALGILALNWKNENYFQSINEIKNQINYLKEEGVVVSFNCRGGSRGGRHPARAPPKIGKNKIFWRKIVIFHTKYPKKFRASLRSAQFFLSAPP